MNSISSNFMFKPQPPIWLYLEIQLYRDKVKWSHKVGTLVRWDQRCVLTEKKAMWGHKKEPGKEVSPETNLTGTLIFDFHLTELWESENSFLFKTPSLWYAVMVAQAE